jgi:hypothetical protein
MCWVVPHNVLVRNLGEGGATLGGKFNLVSTHAKLATSKSYMDVNVAGEVNLDLASLIATTSESTKILDFPSKIQR